MTGDPPVPNSFDESPMAFQVASSTESELLNRIELLESTMADLNLRCADLASAHNELRQRHLEATAALQKSVDTVKRTQGLSDIG